MDKDLLKASIAFLIVLMLYQTFFVKKNLSPQKNDLPTEKTEALVKQPHVKEIKPIQAANKESEFNQNEQKTVTKQETFKQTTETMKMPASSISMSNVGGKIIQVDFLKYKTNSIFNKENAPLAIKRLGSLANIDQLQFQLKNNANNLEGFCNINKDISIKTSFNAAKHDYLYTYEVTINNNSSNEMFFSNGLEIVAGNFSILQNKSRPILNFTKYSVEEKAINLAYKKVKTQTSEDDPFYWAGVQNTTYCSIIKGEDLFQKAKYIKNSSIKNKENISVAVTTKDFSIAAKNSKKFVFNFYLGPKLYFHMKKMENTFENIIDYGSLLGPITKLLVLCLNFLFGLTKNYGLAIILLTIGFKLITYPLTKKSMVSMKEMQKLAPQLKQLQQQHKNNQAEASKATMALYKKHGVNPMSSCFPMLIQMPLFFAFFKAISNSVELQGEAFLLIKDLALPDAIIPLPQTLPLIGASLNVLPLLLGVIQFTSSKQTITDPAQKGMLYGMPIFMTIIFYNMPSALVLYFFVSTLIGIIQNHLIKAS